MQKNRHRKPPQLLSHPCQGNGTVSRKRSIRGKSEHGAILRQPCRYYLESTPCEYWHPSECQFFCKTETGCKAGDECLFPYHKVDEQPNKKPKKGHYSHKRRESDDKNAVAIVKLYHNWVASRKTRVRWFLEEANSPGEMRCKKSWDRFEKYGSLSLRYTSSKYLGK